MKLYIEEDLCTSCESCELVCPEYFKMDDDYMGTVIKQPEEMNDCIQEAMDYCATDAIIFED